MQHMLFQEENITKSWFSDALNALGVKEEPGWPDKFGDKLIEWNQKNSNGIVKVLSLFSGAGGLDIGFHDAGFQVIECVEIEKAFAQTLEYNSSIGKRLSGSHVKCIDINDYHPKLDNIDFIIGGPPCQTFSAAGARAAGVNGTDDDRGNLFKQYVRILKQLKPKGFLFENVYRIVGAQKGKPWKEIQDAFMEAGYKLKWRILDAADYGVPQFRERLIIVGLRDGDYLFPKPTHGPDSDDNRPYYNASTAIDGIISKFKVSRIGGRHGHLLDDIPPGLNYSFYTDRMGHPSPHFGWRSKFSDYLYKADPEMPVRTIKAQGGQYTGPFHWDNRTFFPEELKRLQTFPDDYEIKGNRQKVIQQIGNSVPPQLARILALSIFQEVFNRSFQFKIDLLSDATELGFRTRKSKLTEVYAKKAATAIQSLKIIKKMDIPISESKKSYLKVENNLILQLQDDANHSNFYVESKVENNEIFINLWNNKNIRDSELQYQYSIDVKQNDIGANVVNKISMMSYSDDPQSITAIWKYLETVIRRCYHKDDLVQLFGYYQYSSNYQVILSLNSSKCDDSFWNFLDIITNSKYTGDLLQIDEICKTVEIKKDVLMKHLQVLKRLGFEIRNHNTNKQIKEGYLLIPYCFPSLNERSLQRLTEL